MELQFKHLSPFYTNEPPYLECNTPDGKGLLMYLGQVQCTLANPGNLAQHEVFRFADIVPILHPISQLTEEITHNGKTFVPLVELAKIAHKDFDVSWTFTETLNVTANIDGIVAFFDFNGTFYAFSNYGNTWDLNHLELYRLCREWHFDLDGLIGAGLAIEKPAK